MNKNTISYECALFSEPGIRSGLKDIWNAHMAQGATFGKFDIPLCPTTAKEIPRALVTWDEAKSIHRKCLSAKSNEYHYPAFVCFYLDDYKFDGPRGIWHDSKHALEVLCHFDGVITPDFSTYQDFPEAIKIYATYRMRLLGFWLGRNGVAVINNVRWGTAESWAYSFTGIPVHSIVAIGTVGGSPRLLSHRQCFEEGLSRMVETLRPHTVIVYGSANYSCFENLRAAGIRVLSFPSKKAQAYAGRKRHEQK